MKLMIASDIHGSALWCRRLLDAFDREGAQRLLLLGDLLYHGPRNDLPDGYAPKEVAAMLNERRDKLLCVRGNCEAEVDQMMLTFPVLSDRCTLFVDGRVWLAAHGHHESPKALPPLCEGDVFLSGHTHIPLDEVRGGVRCLNPGSVSLPKAGSARQYLLYENGKFVFKTL